MSQANENVRGETLRLVLATNNPDKIREIRALLNGLAVVVLTRSDFKNFPDPEETESTLEGNARLKALAIGQATGLPALADDTGLEVDALDGAPGVFSARFAGPQATYESNCAHLLMKMQGIPPKNRGARFRCVIALAWPKEEDKALEVETVSGVVEGLISEQVAGAGGFGYDPVFYHPPSGKTFAEMTSEGKNQLSHRGLALQEARLLIQRRLEKS